MTAFIALLRAVNIGGTGKLAMADLKALCEAVGFAKGANLHRQLQCGFRQFLAGSTARNVNTVAKLAEISSKL